MSSFICSPIHFNSAERKIFNMIRYEDRFTTPYELKEILPKCYEHKHYSDESIEDELKTIFNTLRELQVVCVSLQYKHHYDNVDNEISQNIKVLKGDTKTVKHLTPHGLYNALRCINYQIETEHIEELRPLTPEENNAMQFLYDMSNALAHFLVMSMETNEADKWAI